jgi:hypothetical protein
MGSGSYSKDKAEYALNILIFFTSVKTVEH